MELEKAPKSTAYKLQNQGGQWYHSVWPKDLKTSPGTRAVMSEDRWRRPSQLKRRERICPSFAFSFHSGPKHWTMPACTGDGRYLYIVYWNWWSLRKIPPQTHPEIIFHHLPLWPLRQSSRHINVTIVIPLQKRGTERKRIREKEREGREGTGREEGGKKGGRKEGKKDGRKEGDKGEKRGKERESHACFPSRLPPHPPTHTDALSLNFSGQQ